MSSCLINVIHVSFSFTPSVRHPPPLRIRDPFFVYAIPFSKTRAASYSMFQLESIHQYHIKHENKKELKKVGAPGEGGGAGGDGSGGRMG